MEAHPRTPRVTAVRREEERVTALELFFDLVFVLALTQCTALMATDPTWQGLGRGLLVLAVLWWSWGGYAWLTSVVDPEEGTVRLAMFAAMAAFLVAALSVPDAFGNDAFAFACAYGIVRVAHIWLFTIASRDDPGLRRSVTGLAASTAVGVGLLLAASTTDGALQGTLWCVALLLDVGAPFLFWAEGWRLMPAHFAERHGLIILIALGESIVAIGVGSEAVVDASVVAAATLGVALAAALWWLYFDVIAWLAERRLSSAAPGREQNELARDAYSLLHFPMVAGIVLAALGLKTTLAHVGDPLHVVPAAALVGGVGALPPRACRLPVAARPLPEHAAARGCGRRARALPRGQGGTRAAHARTRGRRRLRPRRLRGDPVRGDATPRARRACRRSWLGARPARMRG